MIPIVDFNNNISELILIDEILEINNLIMYLSDSESENSTIILMSLTPYLSLVAEGILDMYPKLDFSNKNYDNFKKVNSKHRATIKILTEKRLNKSETMLGIYSASFKEKLIQDYTIVQKIIIKFFGQEDLGIYSFKGKVFSNTNLYIIYFQSFYSIGNDNEFKGYSSLNSLFEYSRDLSSLINSYANIIKNMECYNLDYFHVGFDFEQVEMHDYYLLDIKRRNIFKNHSNINLSLMILNMKCVLSFSLNVLPELIDNNNSLCLRIQLINYYQMIIALHKIQRKYNILFDNNLESFSKIRLQSEIYFSNNLRGNIFHYKIDSDDFNNYLNCSGSYLFKEMVETETSTSFDVLIKNVREDMLRISEILDNILEKDIELNL